MTTIRKSSITINGQNYNSIEEMPLEIQELIKDSNNNGIPDKFEHNIQQLVRDVNGNGIPDQEEEINSVSSVNPIQMDHMQSEINKKGLILVVLFIMALVAFFLI